MTKALAGLIAGLALAIGVHSITAETASLFDVLAGWLLSLVVFATGHSILLMARKRTTSPALALLVMFGRLFCLIIVYLVVLVSGVFGAEPFTMGMLFGYIMAGWLEVAGIARASAHQQFAK